MQVKREQVADQSFSKPYLIHLILNQYVHIIIIYQTPIR